MKPIVYVDILFLLNFLMNTVTVYISFILNKHKLKLWRLVLASGFLSLYACIVFFPKIEFIYSIMGKVAALILASVIAYPSKSVIKLIKNTALLFLTGAILGGIVFALIFLTNFGTQLGSAVSNGELYLNVEASTLMISIVLAYACVYIAAEIKKTAQIQNRQILNTKIFFQENEISIKGFLDTGCSLYEPLSNTPAIIISQTAAKKLFADKDILSKYRIIPYSTIDNKNGFLPGIFPDRVEINGKEIQKCIIAVSKEKLSPNESFDAIFGTEIFEETKIQERNIAL